jgi:hypothetical protein
LHDEFHDDDEFHDAVGEFDEKIFVLYLQVLLIIVLVMVVDAVPRFHIDLSNAAQDNNQNCRNCQSCRIHQNKNVEVDEDGDGVDTLPPLMMLLLLLMMEGDVWIMDHSFIQLYKNDRS